MPSIGDHPCTAIREYDSVPKLMAAVAEAARRCPRRAFYDQYDSEPPPLATENDYGTTFALGWGI